jgi:hypothetical protein
MEPSTRRIHPPLSRAGCIQPEIEGSRNALEKADTRHEIEIRPFVLKLLQRQFCSHEPVTGQEAAIHW